MLKIKFTHNFINEEIKIWYLCFYAPFLIILIVLIWTTNQYKSDSSALLSRHKDI